VDEGDALAVQGEAGGVSDGARSDERDNLVLAVTGEGVFKGDEAGNHGGGVAVRANTIGEEGVLSEGPGAGINSEATFGIPGGGEGDFQVVALRESAEPSLDGFRFSGGEVPDDVVDGSSSGTRDQTVVTGSTHGGELGSSGVPGVDTASGGGEVSLGVDDTSKTGRGSSSTSSDGGRLSINGGEARSDQENASNKNGVGVRFHFSFRIIEIFKKEKLKKKD